MNDFLTYLDQLKKQFEEEEQSLICAQRKDEANFAKIKVNICDICKTLYQVSLKKAENREAFIEEYLRQLTRLPENWKISYEKAKEHGDATKIVIEEIKLEVLETIRNSFEERTI